nr:FUSC family membrane protein [Azohydromonas caseinilytica]
MRRPGWLRLQPADARARQALRVALSAHVSNGLSAALGLLLVSSGVHWWLGAAAGSVASVGAIVCIPPDHPAPQRGKFWQLLPAALFGLPLFWAIHALQDAPLLRGLLLVPATFLAFLAGAWGKRGLPITMSVTFAAVFAMAVPRHADDGTGLRTAACFALGAGLYLLWATAANALLNRRYRRQMLADAWLALAGLMRLQATRFTPAQGDTPAQAALGPLLRNQAALTDRLQAARDVVLESPRTPQRQRLAALLLHGLELRDHLLACELDLEPLQSRAEHAPVLAGLRTVLEAAAAQAEALADALLIDQPPTAGEKRRERLRRLPWDQIHALAHPGQPATHLARSLANRVRHVADEVARARALARGEREPDLPAVRAAWQLFVSPTAWSWRPFLALWRWDAPPLRHAIRAALAVGTAYALAQALPWGTHEYWVLLTIVVVLRGSLAQTLERRNSRVAGTALGCVLAGALLAAHPPSWLLLLALTLAQAVAHAFAVRRYLATAVAATVLGLVQAYLLHGGGGAGPVFDIVERLADTLLGVGLAWAFAYVLPSWERQQLPGLITRVLKAQARHARIALALGQLQAVDDEPELEWRLARREAYDSLSALVQATQRSLAEPRAVRPPLEPLERVLAHGYQLLAQLTALKTMLLLRRGRLDLAALRAPLAQAAEGIAATLAAGAPMALPAASANAATAALPADLPEQDLNPWALRRLELAVGLAAQLRADAEQVRQALLAGPDGSAPGRSPG